ncbi:MAG: FAD-dependent oxidoreductase [Firmicutes bacterium]|nr:FAD-dependent oxidoreductase [Bacillota bacterium]
MNTFEVIVVGGGTAGTTAAIAAARRGQKTLLIERSGALGGSSTLSLVTPLMDNHLAGQPLNRGLNLEIISRYQESVDSTGPEEASWFDPLLLATVLESMVLEAGVTVLYDAVVSGVELVSGEILTLQVATRGGVLPIAGRTIIDATGDAVVARMANCPVQIGNETGQNQPMSLRFILGNVDKHAVAQAFGAIGVEVSYPRFHVGFHEAKDSPMGPWVQKGIDAGVLAPDDLGYFQFFSLLGRRHSLAFNCPRLSGFAALDPWQISRAYGVGRQKIQRIVRFLREFVPGFAEAEITNVASLIGIRESVRIVGEYTLTEDDYFSARRFADGICLNRYPIDIHHPSGVGTTLKYLPEGVYHEIPYRCLLPQGVKNLLVTGRCISASFAAHAAIRIIPNCRTLGEAAGIAAAIANAAGKSVKEIDGAEVRAQMEL